MQRQQNRLFSERRNQTARQRAKAKNQIKNTPLADRNDPFNDFIWDLARKFTNSAEEAEAAVREMNADMMRFEVERDSPPSNAELLIDQIAWRRLIRFLK